MNTHAHQIKARPRININYLLGTFVCSILFVLGTVTAHSQTATNELKREWGQPTAGFALSITTSNKVYSTGQAIILSVSQKNVKTNDVRVVFREPLDLYDMILNVTRAQKKVPMTTSGKEAVERAKTGPVIHIRTVTLKPGEETLQNVSLDKIFDLSSPGKYTVSVTRMVRKNKDEWTDLLSNEIELIVK